MVIYDNNPSFHIWFCEPPADLFWVPEETKKLSVKWHFSAVLIVWDLWLIIALLGCHLEWKVKSLELPPAAVSTCFVVLKIRNMLLSERTYQAGKKYRRDHRGSELYNLWYFMSDSWFTHVYLMTQSVKWTGIIIWNETLVAKHMESKNKMYLW